MSLTTKSGIFWKSIDSIKNYVTLSRDFGFKQNLKQMTK